MKRIICLVMLMLLAFTSIGVAAEMKLYRNRDWQFRIEIPADFAYRTPKGPNVVVSAAADDGANMNVIVKKFPLQKDGDAELLQEIFAMQRNEYPELFKGYIDSGMTMVERTPVHWYIADVEYRYPDTQFVLRCFGCSLLRNYKYYNISYSCYPQLFEQYRQVFIDSLSSFVDETGFY